MKNRALIIGVSKYPAGISNLPAVSRDVQEIAKLLGSADGSFKDGEVRVFTDAEVKRKPIIQALRDVLENAQASDTIFVYVAGHGLLDANKNFYFIPQDIDPINIAGSAIPLREIKSMFDQSRSERVLLQLDFCHSGGILARGLETQDMSEVSTIVERTLRVTQGRGKVIMCACTADQKAYESGNHGHFTKYLLEGLKGAAANNVGEVTASLLHDYIDRKIGSMQQRPLFFGEMTGRIVLMHARNFVPASATQAETTEANFIVNDSGPWVLLGDHLFQASSVKEKSNGKITVTIRSSIADDDAKIRALKPERHWGSQPLPFAHRNDGFLVRVEAIESESTIEGASWIVTLKSEATEYGGGIMYDVGLSAGNRSYSADQIAELRGRRLLLNDPPPTEHQRGADGMLEHFIQGMGTKFPVTAGIFAKFSVLFRTEPKQAMQMARLAAIYALKASQVLDQVTELRLGPLIGKKLHVRCRGRRRDEYANRKPTELKIEGDYLLE